MPDPRDLRQTVILLQALADPNRLRILKCLQARPACVCELVQATGIPQPRVSRHLGVLRDAGLVVDGRDAQWVEYSLVEADPTSPETALLSLLRDALEDDARILADREGLKHASRDECIPK